MSRGGILIVSASTGTGHARAADALRQALLERDPSLPVEHVDLLDLAPGWVRATYGGGYELMAVRAPWLWHHVYRQTDGQGLDHARWSPLARRLLFRGFQQLLLDSPWRLCVSTHFLPCQLAAGRPGFPPFALAVTDFTLHRYWVQPGVQDYYVATEAMAQELRERVGGAQVTATGIPIRSAFASPPARTTAKRALGLDSKRPVAVIMGGGLGIGIPEMVAASLSGAPESVQLVAICGRNPSAQIQLRELGVPRERLQIHGYVDRASDYMAAADVVVTKPGGLTCSESLALGRPLLLTRPIPGQEAGNTRALVAAGAAISAVGEREIASAMDRLFAGDGLLSGLAFAAQRIGRRDSAKRIANLLYAKLKAEELSIAS